MSKKKHLLQKKKELSNKTAQNHFWRQWFVVGIIILSTFIVYIPAMRSGYIWDDDDYVTNNTTLRNLNGLKRIWFEIGAVPQYYPLVHTTFWIEYHLWGLNPLGYHVVNVMLHILNAILLWLILRGLKIPGSWMAAAIFAIHPVNVESVAWITERKNVLSGFFYLSAILAYLKFSKLSMSSMDTGKSTAALVNQTEILVSNKNNWKYYVIALVLYVCALLSKTVTSSLPVVILLLLWWKQEKLNIRDIVPTVPFFIVGAGLAAVTIWMEKHHVGASGAEWSLTFVDRCLVAGRALCFYAGKLFYPSKFTFIYPRWDINAGLWWQYLFPTAVFSVLIVLWTLRKMIGKSPLVAVLFFTITLFPALGFIDVYPMRYSYVADHFQYLANIGLIVLSVSEIGIVFEQFELWQKYLKYLISILVFLALAILTHQQAQIYENVETLWRDTISKNPSAWMAHNNLGFLLVKSNKYEEAEKKYRDAIRINPNFAEVHNNLGILLYNFKRYEEAEKEYRDAIRIKPNYTDVHNNLGVLLYNLNKYDEAEKEYKEEIMMNPNSVKAHSNLGALLYNLKRYEEAEREYRELIRINPDNARAHNNLGVLLYNSKRYEEAEKEYRELMRINPDYARAHSSLGELLNKSRR